MPNGPRIDLALYERFLTEKGLTWEPAPDGSLFYQNLGRTFVLITAGGNGRRFRMVLPWLRSWGDQDRAIPGPLFATVSRRCQGTVLSVQHDWLRAEIEDAVEDLALLGAAFGRCTTRLVEASGIARDLLGPAPGDPPWKSERTRYSPNLG